MSIGANVHTEGKIKRSELEVIKKLDFFSVITEWLEDENRVIIKLAAGDDLSIFAEVESE